MMPEVAIATQYTFKVSHTNGALISNQRRHGHNIPGAFPLPVRPSPHLLDRTLPYPYPSKRPLHPLQPKPKPVLHNNHPSPNPPKTPPAIPIPTPSNPHRAPPPRKCKYHSSPYPAQTLPHS